MQMRALWFGWLLVVAAACANTDGFASLEEPSPQTVVYGETLSIEIPVKNGGSKQYTLEASAPDLVEFDYRAQFLGASFRFIYSPLSPHIGQHYITLKLKSAGDEVDRKTMLVTVTPNAAAAPVFLRPGPGGLYDLTDCSCTSTEDACVAFDIEVRDDDETEVDISGAGLPEGAVIETTGGKLAHFAWCPSNAQIATSLSWQFTLQADDGDHEPASKRYVASLNAGDNTECETIPPTASFTAPTEGQRVTQSGGGYRVALSASDDMGLRDAPLLYYSTADVEDRDHPDLTSFTQVAFVASGGSYAITIPSLGLADGEERTVYIAARVTDNDDPSGTVCDRTTQTALLSFVAVGAGSTAAGAECDFCVSNDDCESGICSADPFSDAGLCLSACEGGSCERGDCTAIRTTMGISTMACGDAETVCSEGPIVCVDDEAEENDSISTANRRPKDEFVFDGQICSGDGDYFALSPLGSPVGNTALTAAIDFTNADGDLDMEFLDSTGRRLAASESGITDGESVSTCVSGSTTIYAHVYGHAGQQNAYSLYFAADEACCVDDAAEPDDSRGTAALLRLTSGAADLEGTVCPADGDYSKFSVGGPALVAVELLTEGTGTLRMELLSATGAIVARSTGTDPIVLDAEVRTAGTYTLHIFGAGDGDTANYAGSLLVAENDVTCGDTNDCPVGKVCRGTTCGDEVCTPSGASCPTDHSCISTGPDSSDNICSDTCSTNADCRASDDYSCKRIGAGASGKRCILADPPAGGGQNGAACDTHTDCGGQRGCADLPGGYCARLGCDGSASYCESDTKCVMEGDLALCAKKCTAEGGECRLAEGYSCQNVTPIGSTTPVSVCLPAL